MRKPTAETTVRCPGPPSASLEHSGLLTDADQALDETPARVTEWRLPASGPQITFQLE